MPPRTAEQAGDAVPVPAVRSFSRHLSDPEHTAVMKRWVIMIVAVFLLTAFPLLLIESTTYARVTAVAGVCLYLWISEIVPPFVPTLLLWTLVPLVLGPIDQKYAIGNVLSWAVDPVMAA